MQVTPEPSPGALMSAVHTVLIRVGCFLGSVRVMMSVVHAAVWVYCLPVEWTGTPPAEWTELNKCRGGTSPARGMDKAQ
jgi:hypothetical protein